MTSENLYMYIGRTFCLPARIEESTTTSIYTDQNKCTFAPGSLDGKEYKNLSLK